MPRRIKRVDGAKCAVVYHNAGGG